MIDSRAPLLLGSGSPRRREILTSLGIPIRVAKADVDETVRPGEGPEPYLVRVVADKLAAVAALREVTGCAGILVADTSVIVDGVTLGKPEGAAGARAMLRVLSGRAHEVWTRFAVAAVGAPIDPTSITPASIAPARTAPMAPPRAPAAAAPVAAAIAETVRTKVWFRALDEAEIAAYADTGEGLDKAGAYAIQGVGAFAVERIEGSYSNVVGLPACEVVLALRSAGLLGGFPLLGAAPR